MMFFTITTNADLESYDRLNNTNMVPLDSPVLNGEWVGYNLFGSSFLNISYAPPA